MTYKQKYHVNFFGVTPRIVLDSDMGSIIRVLNEKKPDGILVGNLGILNLNLGMPLHLDYNINCFNSIDLDYFSRINALPVISPELSIRELAEFENKNFIAMVHGKIRLMTLRHKLKEGWIKDETGASFRVNNIINGTEILNEKELGLLSKSYRLLGYGINKFFIDTEKDVGKIVKLYRSILDGKSVNDSKIRRNYILGWSYRRVA